jgi:hypothetical protein
VGLLSHKFSSFTADDIEALMESNPIEDYVNCRHECFGFFAETFGAAIIEGARHLDPAWICGLALSSVYL